MNRLGRWLVLILSFAIFQSGCAKPPKAGENSNSNQASPQAQAPAPAQVQGQPQPPINPITQPTLTGDIERISIAIVMAREAAKEQKFEETVARLEGAKREVDSALSRKPRLEEEIQALRLAIDRTIKTVQNRGKAMDSQLTELQTRIGAIKVNTFAR